MSKFVGKNGISIDNKLDDRRLLLIKKRDQDDYGFKYGIATLDGDMVLDCNYNEIIFAHEFLFVSDSMGGSHGYIATYDGTIHTELGKFEMDQHEIMYMGDRPYARLTREDNEKIVIDCKTYSAIISGEDAKFAQILNNGEDFNLFESKTYQGKTSYVDLSGNEYSEDEFDEITKCRLQIDLIYMDAVDEIKRIPDLPFENERRKEIVDRTKGIMSGVKEDLINYLNENRRSENRPLISTKKGAKKPSAFGQNEDE